MDYNTWADSLQQASSGIAGTALAEYKRRNSPAAAKAAAAKAAAAAEAEARRFMPGNMNIQTGDMAPVGIGNALSAFGNANVGDTAAFMGNPLVHKVYSALGMPAAQLPPEAWKQLSQDAREEADYNVQHTGKSLLGRVPGYVGQMLGSITSSPGILSAVATAPIGGLAGGGLARFGVGKVGQILGAETVENVAQGSLQRGLQGDLNNTENLVGDVGGAVLFGGARALKHLYDFSGTPGMARWARTLSDGQSGYVVRSLQREGIAVPDLVIGRSGFTMEEHPQAWKQLVDAAGLDGNERAALLNSQQINAVGGGSVVDTAAGGLAHTAAPVLEKLNAFTQSKQGKKLIDTLDEQYAREVWTTAHAIALKSPDIPDTPAAIAHVADLLHAQRRNGALPDLTGADMNLLTSKLGERSDALKTAFKGWMPGSKVSSDAMKGITPGQVDAALHSAANARNALPPLLPQAQAHVRTSIMHSRPTSPLASIRTIRTSHPKHGARRRRMHVRACSL